MKNILNKVLFVICIYLVAMFLISFLSNIFEPAIPKNKKAINYFLGTEDSMIEQENIQQKKITEQQDKDNLSNNKIKTTKGNPFFIDVNIIYPSNTIENREPDVCKHFIANISYFNIFEEIEKRKSKVLYKRKFCLYAIKYGLKKQYKQKKSNKWRLKNNFFNSSQFLTKENKNDFFK